MKSPLWFVAAPLLVIGIVAAPLADGAADPEKIKALTRAYEASGQQLFKQLGGRSGNIVFSPYSIGTAMAMALTGARGATEAEMAKVLKHGLARTEIDVANAELLTILNGYDRSAERPTCRAGTLSGQRCEAAPASDGGCVFPMRRVGARCVMDATLPPSAKMRVANALMLTKKGNDVSTEYAALLRDKYAAEVFQGAQLADINGWVKRKTEGKIQKILEQLDEDSAAVLLNAIYFKAQWASAFNKRNTRDAPFFLTASVQHPVPMMQRTGPFALVKRQGYRAIRLPYDVKALGMVIALPDDVEGLREVQDRLDVQELTEVLAALRGAGADALVEVALPRFKAEFGSELRPLFRQAGMIKAFSDHEADFSGMARPGSRLVIRQIVHRALIEVAEEGTEAGAATAIEFSRPISISPATPAPEPFRVDRPFLFYIVDDVTGAVLFQGRIVDPR